MRTMPKLCVGIVFASLGASLSNAEAADEPPPATTAPAGDCELSPPDEASPPSADHSLTETLAPCDGVLAPPPMGDRDMTITPPPVGDMPVIEPDEVPIQPAYPE